MRSSLSFHHIDSLNYRTLQKHKVREIALGQNRNVNVDSGQIAKEWTKETRPTSTLNRKEDTSRHEVESANYI